MRDFGADVERLKTLLAAEISGALARERLSMRQAQARTGIAAADFSRIRGRDLQRFTVDRLMAIINRLGSRIEVAVRIERVDPSVDTALDAQPAEPLAAAFSTSASR